MSNTIPFEETAVKKYLDTCIQHWRKQKSKAISLKDAPTWKLAAHYVDAFQSIRHSLFGELLAEEKPG